VSTATTPFARAIKTLRKSGFTQKSIAVKLGVSENTISGMKIGIVNCKWRLGADLLALSEGRYPATMPPGVEDFQDLIGQLKDKGWTNMAIARSVSSSRTSVATVAAKPGFEPRFELADGLIRLHARAITPQTEESGK